MRMEVTPAMAASWLERNTGNRKLSKAYVSDLTEQMLTGKWVYNGQSIVINSDGMLLDGQHRLSACMLSGRSFVTEVVTGITDKNAFATLDTGRVRQASQVLQMSGIKNSPTVAAVTRMIINLRDFGLSNDFVVKSKKYTNCEVMAAAGPECELITKIHYLVREYGGTSPDAFAFWVLYKIDCELADDMLKKLASGLFSSSECPVFQLHKLSTAHASAKKKVQDSSNTKKVALIFKAWNLYGTETRVKRLFWSREYNNFPIPNGYTEGCIQPLQEKHIRAARRAAQSALDYQEEREKRAASQAKPA